MRLLKRTLIFVGILVLLKVVSILLDKYSPYTILFHQSLVTALQLFVFFWYVLGAVIGLFAKKNPARGARITWIVLLLLVVGGELLFSFWLKHPKDIPVSMYHGFKDYYVHNYRNIVQVERSCSEFDSAFFYRLRKNNQCTFSNIEFSNAIKTNSRGFRDDEASLSAPGIICIGDSYTMGWGVEQHEAFPDRLEKSTGIRTLNAGMSSFGTVRELRQLATLDTSACKWVVLQYCNNDVAELKPYVENNYTLETSGAASYDTLVRRSEWNHAYYPGKTFFSVGMYWLKGSIKNMVGRDKGEYKMPVGAAMVTIPESAKLFADALAHSAGLFTNRSLIVLYAYENGRMDTVFIPAVQNLLNTSPYKEKFTSPVYFVNTSDFLTPADGYILDDHYNAEGHRKITEAIKKIIVQ